MDAVRAMADKLWTTTTRCSCGSAVHMDGLGVSINPSRNRVEELLTCGIAPAEAVDAFIKLNVSEMPILDSANPRLPPYQPHHRRDAHIAKKDRASDHGYRG